MDIKFNFNNLRNVYMSTLKSNDKTAAFDLQVGKGKFLFMMYLSDEDKDAKDTLFIYMRNTKTLIKLKMYGSHKKGDFNVYITPKDQAKIVNELCLLHTGSRFDFQRFLKQLNDKIPLNLDQKVKIETLRRNKNIIQSLNIVDEAEKTVLIGPRHLSSGTPKDKTLRKLYLYTDADPSDIATLIKLLKASNQTVAWTTEDKRDKAMDINKLISSLS